MKPEINKSYNTDKKEYYLSMKSRTLQQIKDGGSLQEQMDANQLIIDGLNADNPEDKSMIIELQQENVELNDTKKRRELVLDGNPLKIIEHDIDILLREIEQNKNSNMPDKDSKVSSLKEELNKKLEEKYSVQIRSEVITNNEKLQLMKDKFNRMVKNPDYINSEDAKVDELAIFNLERDIKLLNIGEFDSVKFDNREKALQAHIYNELRQNLELRKFLDFSQDGTSTVTINLAAVEKEKSDTGADADAIISNIKATKTKIGKDYLDQRLELFEEVFEPELFKVAELYYADPDNNLGKIDDSFRTSYKIRSSIIDNLRKGKLGESTTNNQTEEITNNQTEKITNNQTEEILKKANVELPLPKPDAKQRGQNDFPLDEDNLGIDKFVKSSLITDSYATASEITTALEALHETTLSEEQKSFIKSKIVEYSDKDNTSSKTSNKLKDMINDIPKIPGKIVSSYQRSRVINTAKQEYNKLRDKQDISATRKQSDILEDLKIFLRDNNYSSDEIRYEIENIVRPVKKYNSGGLMSKK
jgi:hypothetical protein